MFHTLKYEVTFPNGRRLAADLEFAKGFTAITGSNETGKTMVLEMLRFLLFGSPALRGVADDYRTLRASGSFTIKDQVYSVERTMRKAELKRGEETVASSVSVVNEKIVQLLGFGLLVFDTACSINQGEVERLGEMSAMERKRLVDSVLGIEALDITSRWAMDEARVLEREAEALSRTLRAPQEPTKPEPYRPSIDIEKGRQEAAERAELQGWLAHTRSAPVEPEEVEAVSPELIEERRSLREKIAELRATIRSYPSSVRYTDAELDAVDWAGFQAYEEAQRYIRANPRPAYFPTQLRIFKDDYRALENILQRGGLLARIRDLEEKGTHPCPKCGEEIPLEIEAIDRLKAEAESLEVPRDGIIPPTPPIRKDEIDAALRYAERWDEEAYLKALEVPAVDRPRISMADLATYRHQSLQVGLREMAEAELAEAMLAFDVMPDYEEMGRAHLAYVRALSSFETEKAAYDLWLSARDAKQARLAEIVVDPDAERDWQAARDYDRALADFEREQIVYDTAVAEIDRLTAEVEKHRKVRELMNVLRSLIKQHLMPSLNRVASHLLSGMTGGQRTAIYVDEDFNVTVDDQRLETLSGSGKACANLALRIALGQVLTNRVISVLLADEIDASMDTFRAQQTANILEIIQNSISQVLLVSHKSIEAQNHVNLGGFVGVIAGEAA